MEKCLFCGKIMTFLYSENEQDHMECPDGHEELIFSKRKETMKINNEGIRLLAKLEREMDGGEQPYVMFDGGRAAVEKEVMKELSLQHGQTIDSTIFRRILELHREKWLESAQKKIDRTELEQVKPSDFKID
jgi:hypothetical protein